MDHAIQIQWNETTEDLEGSDRRVISITKTESPSSTSNENPLGISNKVDASKSSILSVSKKSLLSASAHSRATEETRYIDR